MMKPLQKLKKFLALGAIASLALVLAGMRPAVAQAVLNIAASVNDDVITEYDIIQRIRFMIASGSLPNDPNVIRAVRGRILNALVDEKLQLAAGREFGMSIGPDEELQILTAFAQRFGLSADKFLSTNEKAGVDRDHIVDMLSASEIWRAVVTRRFTGRVVVSDTDIANQRRLIEQSRKEPERRLFELVLPLSDGEAQAKKQATDLLEQIKAGTSFQSLALEHSKAPSSKKGGEIGWMSLGRLPQALSAKVQGSTKGALLGPIKFQNSYMLLWVADTRKKQEQASATTMISALRLSFATTRQDGIDPVVVANNYRAAAKDCVQMLQLIDRTGEPSEDMGTRRLRDYPVPFQQALATLPIGQASQPIVHDADRLVSVVMACRRQGGGAGEVTDEELRQLIQGSRLEGHGERLMEELRRNAFIDIRQE